MKKKTIAFILNYAPHYRLHIYKKLGEVLNADFYFGNKVNGNIKKINYEYLPSFKSELKTISFNRFSWLIGWYKIFRKKYSIIILTGDPQILSNWLLLIISKTTNTKVFLHTHGWYGREKLITKTIKKTYYKLSDGLLLYGERAKSLMINEGFDPKYLHVIYNNLDYENQVLIRKTITKDNLYKSLFNNNNPVLIFIGRLTYAKKLDLLIEAQIILENKNLSVNLVFIGEGEAEINLRNKVDISMIDRVCFLGSIYEEQMIAPYLYHADLCVSPGFVGLTAMHSLAYGTPVITHNNFSNQVPEFEAIKEGITGVFFEEDNVNSLVDKIYDWLVSVKDREVIREYCFKEIEEKWNIESQSKIMTSILK